MASGTLYTYLNNFRAYKALIAAQYSGADVKVDPAFEFGVTNKQESFLKKFPQGKVPAFESKNQEYLTESNAIAYFVSSEQFKGSTLYEQALVQQFISYADNEILPASYAWVYPSLSIAQFNKLSVDRAIEDVKGILAYLDNYLLAKTYLVGERITLADITVACSLLQLYQHVLNPEFRKPYINVNRWFDTIVNQPKVVKIIGAFEYCQKSAEFNQKVYSELQGGSEDKKNQVKKEKPKKAVAPKPKKEAKEVEVPEELDAADLILAAEPKSSNPFDALPKGTFNMDEFKKVYSNEEESKSIAYFWEHFDKENYSIWFGEYKYNNELQKVFMSCNLISGMYQRLDKMRKQAFASVCLFGTEGNSSISGVWIWRGQDLAFEMSNDWKVDYDVYTWKKLDANSEETKKLVSEYFAWTATDKEGRPFNQGKIFK
ncbi:Thioredoxin-like fold,Glutathione S-transferase, N-terminal,Glutathione S-transferase, C- [Cinara cedri]|uniref:Elongation factor 1-gamma n=1 Tax=Cinara cedri TaxID=506608 RepID=A0A5E4MQ07_9HEMI|nr:Thioredoxin-like fold,Glutathione S-transferase, N-terminal,Glutathione S-transferase, C- [Cinara cedri]